MPVALHKVQKHISKKRGAADALHENSRDARRLRRAGHRDDRLSRHASMTLKARQPYTDRIEFFHDAVQSIDQPLTDADLTELVTRFINRDTEELTQLQQERRKGRPPTRREEALKQRLQTEEKEFKTGFWMPDLTEEDVLFALKRWNGQWSGLSTLKFLRLFQGGNKQASSFPPKGAS
ncbi:hypothetical protein N7468_009560 [Penicillium chermesinum]|uniref:Translation machinery-associated protein 16 n=1 Tax=Penicillium chermesinum TaxID=63820 RepID=A0A9W9TF42_9EURO|nr:uncharacterized protein N7468_009560 [Penicillium chermesinum]KAJ5220356.1 hypothetical protein N7468_009560 [Penicillium chermesinum]KAJ6157798.1 hypothetical protein N7470_005390 [Penicillium chermesinum]